MEMDEKRRWWSLRYGCWYKNVVLVLILVLVVLVVVVVVMDGSRMELLR